MVTDVLMPKMSLGMVEGKIVKWMKKGGEKVEKGEPLLEIEADKVTTDFEAPSSGVLLKITAQEGDVVPVNEPIAFIGAPGEKLPEVTAPAAETEAQPTAPTVTAAPPAPTVAVPETQGRVKVSPLAKKIALDRGVDLSKIKGTGPGGRIVKADVLRAAEAVAAAPAVAVAATPKPEAPAVPAIYNAARVIPLTSIRKVVFDRMYQSLQSTAQLTLTSEVDVTDLLAFYQTHVKHRDITLNDMLVKACAMALREHPEVNSVFEEEQIKVVEDVNIGVAVSVEGGLIVPVLRNADHKSLRQISAITKRLVERARKGELSLDEITGGTFTLSNLGMFGVEVFTPILNPPQTAILGVGRIAEKPAVVNGQIVVRKKSHLSLTIDHRIIDGAVGAQFLQTLKRHLEDPHLLVL